MYLCIIIPVIGEADNLRQLLPYLLAETAPDGAGGALTRRCIVIADGSRAFDPATAALTACSPEVHHLRCARAGRAHQMNEAAARFGTTADVLYFLHADTRPPAGFVRDIQHSIAAGYPTGCYRFRFDSYHPLLAINAFCTRFRGLACRGGDQSLYLTQRAFADLAGYRPVAIMEDYDIIERIWAAKIPFRVIPRSITVSARKYRANSWLRVQLANWKVFRMYKAGAAPEEMVATYRALLRR